MELMAAIVALESLKRPVAVKLHTDSVYLRDGVTKWIENWRRNGLTLSSAGRCCQTTSSSASSLLKCHC